jgi:hypothetical protein
MKLAGAAGLVLGKDDVGVLFNGAALSPDGATAFPEDGSGSKAGTPIGW